MFSNGNSEDPYEAQYLSVMDAHEHVLRRYVAKAARHDADAAASLFATVRARAWLTEQRSSPRLIRAGC